MKLLTKVLISPSLYMKGKSLNGLHFILGTIRIVAPAALAPANYGATNIIFILHLLNNFAAMFQ